MVERLRLSGPELDEPCTIELLVDEAPDTCAAIVDALPIEGRFVNGKFSGEEAFTLLDEGPTGLGPENWEFDALPGDVGYWYSHWEGGGHERDNDPIDEIVIVYGRRVRVRKGADRASAINLFGRVTENLDEFATVCRRLQREGEKTFVLERA